MELVNEWFPAGKFRKVDTPFRKYSTYEKEIMSALPLKVNTLCKTEMEYHGNFGHPIGQIQHIYIMSRTYICYTAYFMVTQTVSPTLAGLQGLKR